MKLEDIDYFAKKKLSHQAVFELAQTIYDICTADPSNNAEMQRRLTELSRSSGSEHPRQCGNFMAELVAFKSELDQGHTPKWLPESTAPGVKAPDFECTEGTITPVEVKHLNDSRDEHEATFAGKSTGGDVNFDYQTLLAKKVKYLVADAKAKFNHYHTDKGNSTRSPNKLYLFFTKSHNAIAADIANEALSQFDGQKAKTMKDHIEDIARPLLRGTDTTLVVQELSECSNY